VGAIVERERCYDIAAMFVRPRALYRGARAHLLGCEPDFIGDSARIGSVPIACALDGVSCRPEQSAATLGDHPLGRGMPLRRAVGGLCYGGFEAPRVRPRPVVSATPPAASTRIGTIGTSCTVAAIAFTMTQIARGQTCGAFICSESSALA